MGRVSIATRRRLIVIGDVPGAGVRSRTVEGRIALRLARMMGLPSTEEMDDLISTHNLLDEYPPDVWVPPMGMLRDAAATLIPRLVGRPILLLGNRATVAFGLVPRPMWTWRRARLEGLDLLYASIPHPSAVNRTLNNRATYARTVSFLESVVADVRSGMLVERAEEVAEANVRRMPRDELLSCGDVAAYFGVDETTVRMWVSSGLIGYVKIGAGVRFRWLDVHALLAERTIPPRSRMGATPPPALGLPPALAGLDALGRVG